MLTLADVLEALTGVRPTRAGQIITEATVNSRQAIPGSLFVAMPGEHVDGHDFVESAFKRGAVLALVQKDLGNRLPVVNLQKDYNLRDGHCDGWPILPAGAGYAEGASEGGRILAAEATCARDWHHRKCG